MHEHILNIIVKVRKNMLIGPFVNGAAVVFGGLVGAYLSRRMPEPVRKELPQVFGLASIALGVTLIMKAQYMPSVVLSIVLGTLLGELMRIEHGIEKLISKLCNLLKKALPPNDGLSHQDFLTKFISILILFCASGMGVFGAMQEGMTGDPSTLYIKAILDTFTAAIFAATLGYIVITIAIPQIIIQVGLAILVTFIAHLINPAMIADFAAIGGIIMLATGLRICGIKMFYIANMLPALLIIMPLSYCWALFFA